MFLSVALMVKNEEKYLEQCIKSLLPFIPQLQIIILDTGSTDKTVEIAKKYTKFVYYQKWQNDFSVHRNKSFSYCTGDWIMQIDADEQLCFQNNGTPEKLLNFLTNVSPEINAIGIPLKDWRASRNKYVAEFDVVRIFRKNTVTWKRKIHNEAMFDGQAAYFPMAFFRHWGYDLTPEQMKIKANRTITLLDQSLKEDQSDYQSYFYLAQAYSAWLNDNEQALKNAQNYIDFKGFLGKAFNPSIYHLAIGIYMRLEDYDNAMKWINMGLEQNTQNIDVCYDLLQLGLKQAKPEYVAIGAQKYVVAMENFEKNRLTASGQFFFTNNPTCYSLALHYLTTALFEKATIEYGKLQHILPKISDKMKDEIEFKLSEFIKIMGWKRIDEQSAIIMPTDINNNQIMRPGFNVDPKSTIITTPNGSRF